ncbi:hypothetical protein GCM10010885_11620 [Alicyclobacillus cellulosilyticus]|uniref:Sugar ABC transporter substrate-binding protein n=1 Tax=Alicyclobacillus cellulosilyticus TaxID=1003997 RepID=A0A917NIX2_9BACL|nr:sugar ABC transporter substrate-binding protein [Alicyclobacillus cellulosilyticus]GGJ04044.1 hypothetical protein GCM10010885_11620 [Alicyclobacillus cellulosilyticus]
MKPRVLALTAVPVLLAGSVAGCAPGNRGNAEAAQPANLTVLSIQEPGHGKDYFLKQVLIPAFNKKYPNIHVNVIAVPWAQFDSKLSTLVAAGQAPDVFSHWGASGFADYYHRGLIGDLTPYIQKYHWRNPNIPDKLMRVYQVNGRQYGVPIAFFPSFTFYNRTLFRQAGVPVPDYSWNDPRWTWDAMVRDAKRLTKDYGKPDAVYGVNWNMGNADSYGWDWGVDLYNQGAYQTGMPTDNNFANPKYIAAVKAHQDLIYRDRVAPTPAISRAVAGTGDPFLTSKIAMEPVGAWMLGQAAQAKMNFGIAPIPKGPAGTATPVLYTDPLMMAKTSKYKDAAWKFIAFFASTEGQKMWTNTTGYPPADQAAAKDWFDNFKQAGIDPNYLATLNRQAIANGKESPNHLIVGYAQIYDFLQNNLQPVFNSDKDPAKVLPPLRASFNRLLKQVQQAAAQ